MLKKMGKYLPYMEPEAKCQRVRDHEKQAKRIDQNEGCIG